MQCRIFPLVWRPQQSWGVRSQSTWSSRLHPRPDGIAVPPVPALIACGLGGAAALADHLLLERRIRLGRRRLRASYAALRVVSAGVIASLAAFGFLALQPPAVSWPRGIALGAFILLTLVRSRLHGPSATVPATAAAT